MHGSLPWQGRQGDGRESFVQKKKQNVLVDVIDKGLPEEFEHLLKYDYGYLCKLFCNLHQDTGEGLESLTSCFSNNFINPNSDLSGTQEPDPSIMMSMRK
jgi:hypothetical protein